MWQLDQDGWPRTGSTQSTILVISDVFICWPVGPRGKISFFTEYGHIIYQIEGIDEAIALWLFSTKLGRNDRQLRLYQIWGPWGQIWAGPAGSNFIFGWKCSCNISNRIYWRFDCSGTNVVEIGSLDHSRWPQKGKKLIIWTTTSDFFFSKALSQ